MTSTKIEKVGLVKKLMAIRNTQATKVNTTTQCGGLFPRCHRATVYRDIKIRRTSAKSHSCRFDSSKLLMTHTNYVQRYAGSF